MAVPSSPRRGFSPWNVAVYKPRQTAMADDVRRLDRRLEGRYRDKPEKSVLLSAYRANPIFRPHVHVRRIQVSP